MPRLLSIAGAAVIRDLPWGNLAEVGIAGFGVINAGCAWLRLGRDRTGAILHRWRFAGGEVALREPHNKEDQQSDKKKAEHQRL